MIKKLLLSIAIVLAVAIPSTIADAGIRNILFFHPSASFADTQAIQFASASSQVVSAGNHFDQTGTGNFTMCLWAKWAAFTGISAYDSLIAKVNIAGGAYAGIELQYTTGGKLSGTIGSDATHFMEADSTAVTLATGTWNFICWTSSGGTFAANTFYLNGNPVVMTNVSNTYSTSASNSTNFQFGGRSGTYSNVTLNQASIWSTTLSQANVKAIFNAGTPKDVTTLGISGLVGYYYLGNGDNISTAGGVIDHSTSGFNATGVNTPTIVSDAPPTTFTDVNSLAVTSANGNGGVSLAGVGQFPLASPQSACTWAKATGANSEMFSTTDNTGGGGSQFYNDSNVGLQPDVTILDQATHFVGVFTTAVYSQNAWHFVCWTYDGSNTTGGFKIYVDGSSVAVTAQSSGTVNSTANAPTNKLCMGCQKNAGSTTHIFIGKLDLAAQWNAQLSAGDITTLYNAGHGMDYRLQSQAANLVWYYVLGELGDTNTALLDLSGNGNYMPCTNCSLSADVP